MDLFQINTSNNKKLSEANHQLIMSYPELLTKPVPYEIDCVPYELENLGYMDLQKTYLMKNAVVIKIMEHLTMPQYRKIYMSIVKPIFLEVIDRQIKDLEDGDDEGLYKKLDEIKKRFGFKIEPLIDMFIKYL